MQQFSHTRVREARHQLGMTQQALAHAAGVSERNIVRWENDQNTPRSEHIAAIAKATGKDIGFFYVEEAAPLGSPFRRSDNGASRSARDGGGSRARQKGQLK